LPEDRLETVYDQTVEDDDPNSVNYLIDEYTNRINGGNVKYRFQIQMHKPSDSDPDSIFDSFESWDKLLPWHDLAEVTIEEALSYEESILIGFNIKHHPKSLGLIPSYSIFDYNSVSYMRSKTYPAYVARNLAYKLFGMPKKPTEAYRNSQV